MTALLFVLGAYQNCTSSKNEFSKNGSSPVVLNGTGEPYEGKAKFVAYDYDQTCSLSDLDDPKVKFVVERDGSRFFIRKGECLTQGQSYQINNLTLADGDRVEITSEAFYQAFNAKIVAYGGLIFQTDKDVLNGDLIMDLVRSDFDSTKKLQVEIVRKANRNRVMRYFVGEYGAQNSLTDSFNSQEAGLDTTKAAQQTIYTGSFSNLGGTLTVNINDGNQIATVNSQGDVGYAGGIAANQASLANDDPCLNNPNIGAQCSGGSVYAGQYQGGNYMITPGGCDVGITFNAPAINPVCTGTDESNWQRSFAGTNGAITDILNVYNVPDLTAPSLPNELGDFNTQQIVASGFADSDSAAAHCNDLVYGGYSDWYLPSKSELNHLFCHSEGLPPIDLNAASEDLNCASYGGRQELLLGFFADVYWSSNETANGTDGIVYDFFDGGQKVGTKTTTYNLRCARRY